MVFDVSKYELPSEDDIDMKATTHNVGVFLSAYKTARCRVGQPSEPKVTATFSLAPPTLTNTVNNSTENVVIQNIENQEEFKKLDELFRSGFIAINHPNNMEKSERRRKTFFMRYVQGIPVVMIADRLHYHRDVISNDSKQAIIQFSVALDIHVKK